MFASIIKEYLSVLVGISPAELRRREVTLSLAFRDTMTNPFASAAKDLLKDLSHLKIKAADWA